MRHRLIKSMILAVFGALTLALIPANISASWTTGSGNREPIGASSAFTGSVANPVAYYDSKYFPTVEGAVESANAAGSKTVYVIPGTNPTIKRSFTINSGITLCLPYEGTTYINSPASNSTLVQQDNATYMKSKVIVDSGVTITNNGTIYVGGTIGAGGGGGKNGGHTCGNYAQLTFKDNSKLNCNSGSKVYVYGYVTEFTNHNGDYSDNADISSWPKIYLKSGSLLNAPFVVHDFRGGSITSGLYSDRSSKNVIFFNEYEIMNIKPYIEVSYGAQVTVDTWLYASSSAYSSKDIKLIGNSNSYLFQMNSGSTIAFKYNYGNDNTVNSTYGNRYKNFMDIRMYGSFAINSLTLSVAGTSLNTSAYRFAISYLFHLRFYNGSTSFSNMAKMLPGSKFIINSGASITIGDLSIYDSFTDGSDGHTAYPSAAPEADFINNGLVNATKLAGKVKTENNSASLTVSTASITSYEHLSHTGSSFSTTCTYTTINTSLKLRLLKNGSVGSSYTIVGGGTYYSYKDSSNNCGWYSNSGTISYNTNGSSSSFANKTVSIGASGYALTASDLSNTPTKPYYSFDGWYLDDSFTTQATVGMAIYSSVELIAKWSPVNYSISYHFNTMYDGTTISGTASNNANNPTTYNAESSLPLYPASYGSYIFDGWYLDSSFNNKISTVTGDVLTSLSSPYTLNLYGRWYPAGTATYVITYSNSNTDEGCTCIDSETILSVNMSKYVTPDLSTYNSDTTYDKYFDGWYLDSNFNTKYTSYTQITSSCTLYARWYNKNLVTASIAGNDLFSVSRYLNKNSTFTIPDASAYIEIPTGYEMKWTVSGGDLNGNTYSTGDTVTLSTTWGQTINIVGSIVPKSFTLTIKIGTNETATYNVKRNGTTITNGSGSIAASGTATISGVQTGDTVTLTLTASENYTAGSITATNLDGTASPFTVNGSGTPSINVANASQASSCLLPDSLITMADGTQKAVKDIEQGDLVLVFNHETGELDVAPITFNDHDEELLFTVLYLNFSNGKSVGVISEHGFFDLDTMRYEYIREDNYQEFIGHRFYTEEGDEAILTSVDVRVELTECYSPTSFYHFDYFVEGMLSMPGGITGLFNIFEYGEDLKYDEEAYNRDIETYGLFTYEDLAPLGVTEIMFEAYAGKYLKVALGKGILTEEYLEYLIARYGGFTEEP